MHLLCLFAALLGVAYTSDLAKPSCANKCTKTKQIAQASAFCSSYESISAVTFTTYPHIVTKPAACCLPCAAQATETAAAKLPAFFAPEPAAKTTSPPTRPGCLGTATAPAATSSECSCLSLTAKTTTVTYSSTLTVTGPFYVSAAGAIPTDSYLGLEYTPAGVVIVDVAPASSAGKFYLDQFGRLFDSASAGVPFSVAPGGGPVEQVYPLPGESPPARETLTCKTNSIGGCPFDCSAGGLDLTLDCQKTWYLDNAKPTGCTQMELFLRTATQGV